VQENYKKKNCISSRSTKKGGTRKLQEKLLLAPESTYQGGARKGSAPEVLTKVVQEKDQFQKYLTKVVKEKNSAPEKYLTMVVQETVSFPEVLAKRRCKKRIPSAPEVNTKVVQENYLRAPKNQERSKKQNQLLKK